MSYVLSYTTFLLVFYDIFIDKVVCDFQKAQDIVIFLKKTLDKI